MNNNQLSTIYQGVHITHFSINEAKDKNEAWQVVNDITKPKKETEWQLNEEGTIISDE